VESHTDRMAGLSDDALKQQAMELRLVLRRSGGFEHDIVARSFALIRETASRVIGMRHYPVQLVGGYSLLKGMLAEMETGEGKTLTATLAAGTAALAGLPVHIITVNDYLAQRDAKWMAPVYAFLGLSVGVVVSGRSADEKRQAYDCDITYCTNKDIAFDYMRDCLEPGRVHSNLQFQTERLVTGAGRAPKLLLRGLSFAIVDEADSVLVDEARTPLIISGEVDPPFDAGILEQ
ncbi:MAG: DEAD/DEAH box helicase, partial [bacterium]|nr:DEAD/DEAH box helicase [bacterium]